MLLFGFGRAGAQPVLSPRAQLKESIEQLKASPDDAALREKIIALARTIKPRPAVSEDARRHFVMATTMQKKAKNPRDYAEAIAEYDAALLLAPWWADAYYNLSVVDEAAGRFDAARDALKLFLATKPKEADARQAQDRIYALEAQKKLQVSEESTKAAESGAREEAAREKFIVSILGHWQWGNNTMSIDVSRGSGAGVAITCRYASPRGDWEGYDIEVTATRVRFKCTDTMSFTRNFSFAFDDAGRFIGTDSVFRNGEPMKWADGRVVEPETYPWSR